VLVFMGVWFFLLRTQATRLRSGDEFDRLINTGQPVIVDFFSNT
jgi:hypothetical protein